ncbi:MAG: DUF4097 family beta strand repeat protein [Candidatus Marinimicrobia bacterium]|jgi:DUF4097 and DUF4098 domain-containing protein YvlB|nr:DUF4097 family beta strand repeat protein [Candidatus Neomarinimicrobiota bacterium]MBT4360222.1 DUF4097 family beta strand repeat protein [Candidatus Neomarinimicrobiota bacterium]MBT4715364.1 DUF4097 family beta strand repeat protein [Candidatus Neomarinimicrobiota bacterium]MBT4946810.1 DUF4097 family beta strand repeat protein [Candidatus Neomarinimicrobiota bacterium]MBT5269972.1 DUF4097 family beta strand repeat protein [Candidatus Neomarinimicrobiota bacterium]
MKSRAIITVVSILLGLSSLAYAQSSVSKDIHIAKDKKSSRNVSTVSGDIFVGNGTVVKGDVSAVSGDISIGSKARVGNIEVVSGNISIGKGAKTVNLEAVSGDIHLYEKSDVGGSIGTVSGDVNCDSGSDIVKSIKTVSGDVELDDSRLRGSLKTVSGDISLFNGSMIDGDIIIDRKSDVVRFHDGKLKIIIDMNSVVKGSILVKEPDSNVIVYLANGGKVRGEIVNAEVRKQ